MFESGRARPKKILAIDWDARTLRVVHALSGKRGVKIDRILSVAVPSDVDTTDAAAMGQHIRRVLEQESISTRVAMIDVPRNQTILKTLSLPVIRPEELAGVVEIQIAKELPFPVTQAVIDFTIGATHEDGRTQDVLVSAVQHEVIEEFKVTFATAGLRLDRIGLRPHASRVAICKLLEFSMPERVLFIDVRLPFTEIDVIKQSHLSFSFAASVHLPDDLSGSGVFSILRSEPEAEASEGEGSTGPVAPMLGRPSPMETAINSLVMDVTKSIEAYRATDAGAMIDQVVIGGDTGVEEKLADAIQKRMGLPTELYNPAAGFGWEPDAGAGAAGFAPTLGLVLDYADDSTMHFDFLHPKKLVSASQERLKKAPWVAAAIVMFAFASAYGAWAITKADRTELAQLKKQVDDLQGHTKENRKFLDLMQELRDFDEHQYIWIDEWYDVFALLPSNQDMVIDSVDMSEKDGLIKLKTKGKLRDTALEVIEKLESFRRDGHDQPRYKVTMGPQTERKGDAYSFHQELRIRILNDTEKKSSKKHKRGRG